MFTRTLVLSLILSLFASFASAQDTTVQPACGSVRSVPPQTHLTVALRCSCSGGQIVFEGKQEWPGGKLGGSYISDDKLICQGYILTPGHDTFVPSGNAMVEFDSFVYGTLSAPKCDTSDCGQFLGFLWSIGKAECTEMIEHGFGAYGLYKIVGDCPGPEGPMVTPNFRGPYSTYPLFVSPAGRNQ